MLQQVVIVVLFMCMYRQILKICKHEDALVFSGIDLKYNKSWLLTPLNRRQEINFTLLMKKGSVFLTGY